MPTRKTRKYKTNRKNNTQKNRKNNTQKKRKYKKNIKTQKIKGGMIDVLSAATAIAAVAAVTEIIRVSTEEVSIESLIQTTSGNKDFMRLCAKHIMTPELDSVLQTSWLNNNKCNIFLIGEEHGLYTQCKSIHKMLYMLTHDTEYKSLLDSKDRKIDLIIEYLQSDAVNRLSPEMYRLRPNKQVTQLNNVRIEFNSCIQMRNCPIRVHWGDPTVTNYENPDKDIPPWLNDLAESEINTDDWTLYPHIREQLKTPDDIIKLLTENRKVINAINKATYVNKSFTLEFAKLHFTRLINNEIRNFIRNSNFNWKVHVVGISRAVMDIYTVARIIKLEMKNVIFYGGYYHTTNIIDMLSDLQFNKIKVITGVCAKKNKEMEAEKTRKSVAVVAAVAAAEAVGKQLAALAAEAGATRDQQLTLAKIVLQAGKEAAEAAAAEGAGETEQVAVAKAAAEASVAATSFPVSSSPVTIPIKEKLDELKAERRERRLKKERAESKGEAIGESKEESKGESKGESVAESVAESKGEATGEATGEAETAETAAEEAETAAAAPAEASPAADDFERLCLKHIMVPTLDGVVVTTWLKKDDCNIFLIGENHKIYTQCDSIFKMFDNLIRDLILDRSYRRLIFSPNSKLELKLDLKIDLMIEILQSTSRYEPGNINGEYNENDIQLNNVRNRFRNCIMSRDAKLPQCPLRVHWTDPTQTIYDIPDKNIPQWLINLAQINTEDNMISTTWTKDKLISAHLTSVEDILKLLTDNRKVMNAILSASKVNKDFTVKFATALFLKKIATSLDEYFPADWQEIVHIMLRHVMDFYVVARIIKLDMKNVIFYGGFHHTTYISEILSELGFKTINVVKGECAEG